MVINIFINNLLSYIYYYIILFEYFFLLPSILVFEIESCQNKILYIFFN